MSNKTQCSTLGIIARNYVMEVKTLMTLIEANPELLEDINKYIVNVKHKAKKILPPILVAKIYDTLGEP